MRISSSLWSLVVGAVLAILVGCDGIGYSRSNLSACERLVLVNSAEAGFNPLRTAPSLWPEAEVRRHFGYLLEKKGKSLEASDLNLLDNNWFIDETETKAGCFVLDKTSAIFGIVELREDSEGLTILDAYLTKAPE